MVGGGTSLTSYDAQFAADAARYAEQEQAGGNFITTRGGILQIGESPLPGNVMCAVILDSVFENTYYDERFDPNSITPPRCYAFARGDDKGAMGPHESMRSHPYFVPQHVVDGTVHGCHGCPRNVFGTADQGRGKACSNRRRLAVMAAGFYERKAGQRDLSLRLFTDEAHYRTADIYLLKLPVTSVKAYSRYVQNVASQHNMPPYGVVTEIRMEPDPKSQFKLSFEMSDVFPPSFHPILYQRHQDAVATIITPYGPPEAPQENAPQGRRGTGQHGFPPR